MFPSLVVAGNDPLGIETEVRVSEEGKVSIDLTIENISNNILYRIKPMFHFHHAMSPMPVISSLKPGESRNLTNEKHPKVLRSGRYPLVVMANYTKSFQGDNREVQTYMSFFDYRESLRSAIYARLESDPGSKAALLKVTLENRSDSFKNLRMMLLLPEGLKAEIFNGGMLGFTIRGREIKKIEIPVAKMSNTLGGKYAVFLMTEYGEMEKHYSDEVRGTLLFESSWEEISYKTHIWLIAGLSIVCAWSFHLRKRNKRLKSAPLI